MSPTFRIALHHDGTDAEAGVFAKDTERIVREAVAIFGEFPRFENNTYTFLSDYLPWASGDGMEHRNSTVLSSPGALRNPGQRTGMLGTVAHEFFHAWNMERIRSRDLEPFNFEEADVSGELWLGEGFTSYYDDLIMRRAGLTPLEQTLDSFAGTINAVTPAPARKFRTAEDMSRLAPFVDAAATIDRTTLGQHVHLVLHVWRGDRAWRSICRCAIGRTAARRSTPTCERSGRRHGRPGQKTPGMVATPYTMDDLKAVLGRGERRPAFRADVLRPITSRATTSSITRPLLARAGLTLRSAIQARAFFTGSQQLNFEGGGGARVTAPVPFDSWLYKAGVERDDLIVSIDDVSSRLAAALDELLRRHKPGDQVPHPFRAPRRRNA